MRRDEKRNLPMEPNRDCRKGRSGHKLASL